MATVEENVVELVIERTGNEVQVVSPNRHIMRMPVNVAVAACRAFTNQIEFNDQFGLLQRRLGEWIMEHRDRIATAYLTTRDTGLLFLVVQKSEAFDDQLVEELTELDIEVANDSDYNLIRLTVHVIPNCPPDTVSSFLSRELRLRFRALDGD